MGIKNREEILNFLKDIQENCLKNYNDNKNLKDLVPPYENLNDKCKVNNLQDKYNETLKQLRENVTEIVAEICNAQEGGVNIVDLLNFSQEEVCNQYQVEIEKNISEKFRNFPIKSIIKTDVLKDKPTLYYYSQNSQKNKEQSGGNINGNDDDKSNNKNNLNIPLYGENFLTKYDGCQLLSLRFIKILNLVGVILVLLDEKMSIIKDDIHNKNFKLNNDKPFFLRQLDTIMEITENGDYKINLCDKENFDIFNTGNIRIEDILPITIFKNLYKIYNLKENDSGNKKLDFTIDESYSKFHDEILNLLATKENEEKKEDKGEGNSEGKLEDYGNKKLKKIMDLIPQQRSFEQWEPNCEKHKKLIINKNKTENTDIINLINNFNLLRGIYLKTIIKLISYLFNYDNSKNQNNNLFLYCYQQEDINSCLNRTEEKNLYFTSLQELKKGKILISDNNLIKFINSQNKETIIPLEMPGIDKGTEIKIIDVLDISSNEDGESIKNELITSKHLKFILSIGDNQFISPDFNNSVPGKWQINFTIDDDRIKKINEDIKKIINDFLINFENKYAEIVTTIYNLFDTLQINFIDSVNCLTDENNQIQENNQINMNNDKEQKYKLFFPIDNISFNNIKDKQEQIINIINHTISNETNIPLNNISTILKNSEMGGGKIKSKKNRKKIIKSHKQKGGNNSIFVETEITANISDINKINSEKDNIIKKISENIKIFIDKLEEGEENKKNNLIGGMRKKSQKHKRYRKHRKNSKKTGGKYQEVPLRNCSMNKGIQNCVTNSLKHVVTANKPIYYGNMKQPFNTALQIAENLQADKRGWNEWKINNIGYN